MFAWLFGKKRETWDVVPFDSNDGPRWRIVSPGNGEIIATSEAYSSAYKRDQTMEKLTRVKLKVRE